MSRASPFRTLSEQHCGAWRRLTAVDCQDCGAQLAAHIKSVSDDVRQTYFAGRGWSVGRTTADHRCPACTAHPTQARKPQEPDHMEAAKPREATREDRRKISDALDEYYLPERGCYAKSFSDKALADKLGLPRAWVAEERDRLFGPDVNEAGAAANAEIMALERRAQAAEDLAMKAAAEAETVKKDAAVLRNRIAKAA